MSFPPPTLPVPVLQPVLGDGLPQGDWGPGKQWPTGLALWRGLFPWGLFFPWLSFFPNHFIFLALVCSGSMRLQV